MYRVGDVEGKTCVFGTGREVMIVIQRVLIVIALTAAVGGIITCALAGNPVGAIWAGIALFYMGRCAIQDWR